MNKPPRIDADRQNPRGSAQINPRQSALTKENEKHIEELKALKKEITAHLEALEFHLAAEKLYHYFWHTFADKIIEEAKPRLRQGSGGQARSPKEEEDATAAYHLLETILLECLVMLHPFIPFITEAVYQRFLPAEASAKEGRPGKLLMIEPWDKAE